jgi:multidrug transporter EmrE-like cation transporter
MNTGLVVENPEVVLKTDEVERTHNSTLWQWAALGTILLASCGHLLIKLGVTAAGHGALATGLAARILHYFLEPVTIAGLAIYGVGTLLWIYAVSQRNISFLYPLTALTYVMVAVGGRFMFAENISSGRWAGIGVVVLGVAMLQLSAKGEKA